ncbi:MAG: PTS ascorbate transporter subunit IIC [Aerococcaceae bacterium]|nr:PTS ascorbate transporter subunit IIC [Aerococcaceae bacterium]
MDFLLPIWQFFFANILTKPAFFVGFIVLLGYLLLGRKWYDALAGFIKAVVGYLILNVAAGGLVTNFRPILAALGNRFNLQAVVIDPYFGQSAAEAALKNFEHATGLTMQVLLVAFLTNLVLVIFRKVTKLRTVFITGHIMVQQSATATWLLVFAFGESLKGMSFVLTLGALLGIYWAVSSNLTVEPTQELTEGGGFAIGHQQMFGIWAVDKLAPKLAGKNSKKIEDLELPGFLSIFKESIVATSILMMVFFGAILVVLGKDYLVSINGQEILTSANAKAFTMTTLKETDSFFFYILNTALTFTVYVQILQLGVRLFVSELSEAFQGISNKLLPGSMPAIDCAAVYGFGHPNAVTVGFLFGLLGQVLAILGLVIFKSPVLIITGFVPVFFDNATFAVYANRKGGLRAAAILTFCSGVIQVLGGAAAAYMFQLDKFGGWHGNFDWSTFWLGGGWLMKFGFVGIAIIAIVLLAIPQLQYLKNKQHYFTIAEDYESYVEATN